MSEWYVQRSYGQFEPFVRDIRAGMEAGEFVGGGAESSVWRVTLGGLDYAIKLINAYSHRGRRRDVRKAAEGKLQAGLRGLGISGLEQICAASPEDGAVVYEFVDGVNLSKMNGAVRSEVTPAHLKELQRTVLLATEAGIEFDGWNTDASNAFFSPQKGFTLIDYWARENVTYEHNLGSAVKSLGGIGVKFAEIATA